MTGARPPPQEIVTKTITAIYIKEYTLTMNNTTLFDNMFAIEFNDDTPNDVLFEAAARADDLRAFAVEMTTDKIIHAKAQEVADYFESKFDFIFNIICERDLYDEFYKFHDSFGLCIEH